MTLIHCDHLPIVRRLQSSDEPRAKTPFGDRSFEAAGFIANSIRRRPWTLQTLYSNRIYSTELAAPNK